MPGQQREGSGSNAPLFIPKQTRGRKLRKNEKRWLAFEAEGSSRFHGRPVAYHWTAWCETRCHSISCASEKYVQAVNVA